MRQPGHQAIGYSGEVLERMVVMMLIDDSVDVTCGL